MSSSSRRPRKLNPAATDGQASSGGSPAFGGVRPPPASFRQEISKIKPTLALDIANWLKKHGKVVHPPLSSRSRRQLKECFDLMDADGSGAIDADELHSAFQLLGLPMKRPEVVELLDEVDKDKSGEVDYVEFLQIMTTTLGRNAEEKSDDSGDASARMPFSLMATAYRRKRLMEGLVSRDSSVQQQLTKMAGQMEEEQGKQNASSSSTKELFSDRSRPDDAVSVNYSLLARSYREATVEKRSGEMESAVAKARDQRIEEKVRQLRAQLDREVSPQLRTVGSRVGRSFRQELPPLTRRDGTKSSLSGRLSPGTMPHSRNRSTAEMNASFAHRRRSPTPKARWVQRHVRRLTPLNTTETPQLRMAGPSCATFPQRCSSRLDIRQNRIMNKRLFHQAALLCGD